MTDLDVQLVPQVDRRLGRQKVHDPQSRAFAAGVTVDSSSWRTKSVRIYDPLPNPNQPVGCCTGCAKAMEFNAVGNRRRGVVLDLGWALDQYRLYTRIDPFEGSWEPDDTGSSSLASCKGAQQTGDGGAYRWLFGGADEVVQTIMAGRVVNLGTWWYARMFSPDRTGRIEPGGTLAGGHEYVARGYIEATDDVVIRCWWGQGFRDVKIRRTHLNDLILDGGDAHLQDRAAA